MMRRQSPVQFVRLCSLALTLFLMVVAPLAAAPSGNGLAQLDQRIGSLSTKSNLLLAEFRGSTCQTIHGQNQDQRLAIASTFKLYVFGELARQIQLGQVSWDQQVVISDDLRSMPSGDFAYAPAGTRATVRQLAEGMILHSDNTATDHLITLLGREHVQRAFRIYGHGDAAVNSPLLLTREMFGIKMTQSPEWMRTYEAASDDEQMAMLTNAIDPLRINPAGGWGNWNGPTAIDGIEWFASADDLCRVTASLWSIGAQKGLEPVREILSGNRFGVTDTGLWPLVGYKGGYEAGVVNITFVMERKDGRVFFVSAGFNDPTINVDTATARMYLDPLIGCLAVYADAFSCS